MSEATPKTPIFQHGLLKPERGHMTTLFTLIIFWLVGTIVGAVLLPYAAQRLTDGWWAQNSSILFVTSLCFVSTLHGALAYMMGYRRGGRVSNFFIGALLLTLGLVVVLILHRNRPEAPPQPSRGLMKKADRLAFLTGNLWFGISQLTVMMGFLMVATVYETKVGGSEGNRAAYAAYYNHWSFGLIFVLFFVTIFCTTMRKWPFRISQIGWLSTHLGLLVTMAGCMVMFWGTYDGFAKLLEGDTITHVSSRSERELRIAIPALRFDQKFLVEVDRDPEESDVRQEIKFSVPTKAGQREFVARIDRFYSKADEFEEVRENPQGSTGEGSAAKAGFNFEITIPEQGTRKLFALEDAPQLSRGMPLQPRVIRVTHRSILDAFAYRYPATEKRRGRLIVEDKRGQEIASVVITPGARDADPRLGAAVNATIPLPNGANLSVDRYFSYLVGDEQGLRDESPNQPALPGIRFRVTDAQGSENHSARIDGHWFNSDTQRAEDSRHPYVFHYVAKASNPRPNGSITYVVGPKPEDRHLVIAGLSNNARILPYVEDRVYRLAPNAPITVKALDAYDDAVHVSGVKKGERNAPYGIRVALESGSQVAPKTWVFDYQRDLLTEDIQLGDLLVKLGYGPRQTPLGFTLSLIDFRHENYPNSQKAKRFEANVIVNDSEAGGVGTALIDMNHPLQHRDFRFFNQNPIGDDKGRRGVIFSVGNNPGMPTLLVGFTITTIGLILVFFFKPSLRRWETRRREERAAIQA